MRAYDILKLGTIATVLVLGLSCAQTPPPSQKAMEMRGREAFTLRMKADPQLNLYAGTSHALHLCVYQLSNPNPFNQFSMDMAGISKLMNCERFDQGVALASRIVVQPGDNVNMPIDRAEGARYVGIVAGYYTLNNQSSVRLYQIPLIEEKRGAQLVTRMAPLEIDLYLGPQAIQSAR